MMQESSGMASDYITTTIQFLENTFRAFTHLPVRAGREKKFACFTSLSIRVNAILFFRFS